MATPVPISLGVRSNPGRHGHDGAARLINAYAEKAGEEGKIPYPIYAIDGQTSFATLTGGAGVRAGLVLEAEGRAKVVSGRVLYNVDSGGAVTTIGGIPSDGLVTMARNRKTPVTQVGIVCDGLYFIETNNTLQQVSDPDLPPPVSISFANGYFVLPVSSGRYYVTAVDEGTTIDALDFASAEANPDGLLRSAVRSTTLILLGPLSTEFHEPVDGDFPFQRQSVIGVGCYAAGGVAELTAIIQGRSVDTVIWPGTNSKGDYTGVFMLDGYSAVKISDHAVDRSIQGETNKASILATSWASRGHVFYSISGDTFTWVYNTVTGFWHEQQSYNLARWRYSVAVNIAGKLILGDYNAGTLVESRSSLYDENGQPIIWTIQTPPIHMFPHRMRANAVFIDMVPGVGINSSDDYLSNPKVMFDYSRDGGKNWSAQRMLNVGAQGQHLKRVVARRLGIMPRGGMTARVSMSAAVVRGCTGMSIDADKLAA